MEDRKKVNEIVNNYNEKEILEALFMKTGCSLDRLNELVDEYCVEDYKKEDDTTYSTPNGKIKKIDIFKGKKALVGDYSHVSFFNTEMVLDSLGIEIVNAKSSNEVLERIKNGEQNLNDKISLLDNEKKKLLLNIESLNKQIKEGNNTIKSLEKSIKEQAIDANKINAN